MTTFIRKKVEVEDRDARLVFRPGQFRREPFSLAARNIYLTGLRASGKTTLGKALAKALGCGFVDTDGLVVDAAGCTIDRLVADKGWEYFRELEKQALVQAAVLPGKVVATGGGIVLAPENRELMNSTGVVFYLAADAALMAKRLMADPNTLTQRPALTTLDLHDEIATLMTEREPLYMSTMDHMLQAHREVEILVNDLLVALDLKEWDYEDRERIMDRY